MRASKFPVTYNGEAFRVTVRTTEDKLTEEPMHIVKVYVARTGAFARVKRYKRVYTTVFRNDPNKVDDVIRSARAAVIRYDIRRKEAAEKLEVKERERITEAEAWRKFTDWDGNISVKEDSVNDE